MANSDCSKTRTILVAIDESEHSMHALGWALDTLIVCKEQEADKIILLHAKQPPTSRAALGGPGYLLSAELIVSIDKAQDREIAEFMNKALQLCQGKQMTAETMVVSGDPRDVICETVEKVRADFLVIGSHGYGAIKRAVLGSVSDYCAHHAKCPVVIVKKPHKSSHATDHH